MGDYYYDKSGTINVQQIKPPAVAEAEFRLADDMFSLSNLVGGPNGSKLTDSYREVLFGLVPSNKETADELAKLVPDQKMIFNWLYEEVDNFDPPQTNLLSLIPDDKNLPRKPHAVKDKLPASVARLRDPEKSPKIPRVDLYQKLDDTADQAKFNAYDWLLSNYAPVIDSKLEVLWTVLLIIAYAAGAQDIKALDKTELDARTTLSNSEVAMLQGFSSNVINYVKIYFDVTTWQSQNKLDALKALTDANKDELNQALEK
ncbi:hypothetical protein CFD26_103539 [Aspergillus turcosus]|uniref:Uncharacterized protein n=1 Tax=Aspergillus turcosus TaxID=1245748 RepID=A0A3R7FRQ5_9EURO|nr:hypothetical protein CFD26_103539 [Aspergillus turcosus]